MDEWRFGKCVKLIIAERVDANHGVVRYHFVQIQIAVPVPNEQRTKSVKNKNKLNYIWDENLKSLFLPVKNRFARIRS